MKQTNGADSSAYLPRWRALLLARVRLGEEAKLWRDGPRYCVGVVARRLAPGRAEVRLCGEGASWREAINLYSFVRRSRVDSPRRLGFPEWKYGRNKESPKIGKSLRY